jgi:hypothetical protein
MNCAYQSLFVAAVEPSFHGRFSKKECPSPQREYESMSFRTPALKAAAKPTEQCESESRPIRRRHRTPSNLTGRSPYPR